jgi:hypothetical protein
MADGQERRAQINTETVRGLLLINGGGAVALLALLPTLLERPKFASLTLAASVGVLLLVVGVACAVVHNWYRAKCSAELEQQKGPPPTRKTLLGKVRVKRPTACGLSVFFMWSSLGAFVAAGTIVAVSGIVVLGRLPGP